MSENKKKILEMLAAGKISVDEAAKLLSALGEESGSANEKGAEMTGRKISYLRVVVDHLKDDEKDKPEKVNIKVPVALIRAGMKFTSLIPEEASDEVDKALRDKGIKMNLKNLKEEDMEALLTALSDLEVDIDDGKGTVKIHAE
jgi:hypothetical protein